MTLIAYVFCTMLISFAVKAALFNISTSLSFFIASITIGAVASVIIIVMTIIKMTTLL